MNRKLLVTLLRKDIQELSLITEGFMEMNEYPKSIISLAERKVEDIQLYIQQLSKLKADLVADEEVESTLPAEIPAEEIVLYPVENEIVAEVYVELDAEEEVVEEDEIDEFEDEDDEIEDETEEIEVKEVKAETIKEAEFTDSLIEVVFEEPERLPLTEVSEEPLIEEPQNSFIEEKSNKIAVSRNELLSKTDNSLGSLLANKKIDDVKQAINIGDRFRFQRELFKGNGEDMNKTLTYINQLATLDEVLSFLQSKYNWADENEAVDDFLQIVRRRFV